jgi:hypothetical protein
MNARDLIIETLLKEASEEEKTAANALQSAVKDLASSLQKNKDAVSPKVQNEALAFAIAGSIVSAPALLKIFGKVAAKVEGWVKGKKVETNAIIKMADKLHHILIGGIEKALFFVKDKKARHRLAVIIFHAIVAGLLVASGKALAGALAKHKTGMSIFEGVLSAIKSGELGTYLTTTFGEVAEAIGLGAELLDAADLADAIELSDADLMETSTMGAGAVEGTACGLGKKAEIYNTWNQKSLEETNMNKLKITKGRLRKIIAEEVARHNGPRLNEMGAKEEEAEASEEASETDAAQYMTQAEGVIGEDHRDEEDWEAHFKGGAEDDWSQIHKLEKDARYDARQGRELRGDRKDARTRMSVSAAEDEYPDSEEEARRYREEGSEGDWYSDEHETLADRKYADSLREQVKETLEEMLSDEPVEEGLEDRLAKFNKGPSTEERREKLKKITAANKAKKEKDKK